jgi:hypothetical protein
MKKKIFLFPFILTFLKLTLVPKALAVCPVCTIAVGAGLGLSRWLGIDDTVSGIWVGGLILSMSFWIDDWLVKKNIKINYQLPLTIIAMYALTLLPLKYQGVIGHPFNQIFGVDKLIFGIILGSFVFIAGIYADKKVRSIKGHQLFDFQKVVFPVSALFIFSVIMFIITSVNIKSN